MSALLTGWLLGLAPLTALLLGAIVTPTDPVVASSIVTGQAAEEKLPDYLRSTLSLESGANDGLGYALVMLPVVFLATQPPDAPWQNWLLDVITQGILGAAVFGLALGLSVGWLLRVVHRNDLIEQHSLLSLGIALSVLALTGGTLLGTDGIIAAFTAGAGFNIAANK